MINITHGNSNLELNEDYKALNHRYLKNQNFLNCDKIMTSLIDL